MALINLVIARIKHQKRLTKLRVRAEDDPQILLRYNLEYTDYKDSILHRSVINEFIYNMVIGQVVGRVFNYGLRKVLSKIGLKAVSFKIPAAMEPYLQLDVIQYYGLTDPLKKLNKAVNIVLNIIIRSQMSKFSMK